MQQQSKKKSLRQIKWVLQFSDLDKYFSFAQRKKEKHVLKANFFLSIDKCKPAARMHK